MDEREFVGSRDAAWSRLAGIVAKASGRGGMRALSREELRELGPLYRRASADLAYARAHAVSQNLQGYLNGLVARAYALLYQTESGGWQGMRHFFARDLPRTFRRRLPFFLAAWGFMFIGAAVSYALVMQAESNVWLFIPEQFKESLAVWKSGKVSNRIDDSLGAFMASQLMTNNIRVSFMAFAFGILGGVLTAFLMFYNGAMLGAFAGEMTYVHQHASFWPGIVPHGVWELSAIAMSGAAGLSLGWALLAPGAYNRRDSLMLAARDTVKLVVGTVAMLIFAGIVEAFVSHSLLSRGVRVTFGVVSGVALYAYLFLSGRQPAGDEPAA